MSTNKNIVQSKTAISTPNKQRSAELVSDYLWFTILIVGHLPPLSLKQSSYAKDRTQRELHQTDLQISEILRSVSF